MIWGVFRSDQSLHLQFGRHTQFVDVDELAIDDRQGLIRLGIGRIKREHRSNQRPQRFLFLQRLSLAFLGELLHHRLELFRVLACTFHSVIRRTEAEG